MVHLIPSRINYNASQLAELMFENIYKIHGLPQNIISDRDVLFTSTFWSRLHRLIGTRLRMSSAYHPQSDGSTERANRTVTQMLRQCIQPNQKDWVSKLPAIEFAINSARSESTGYAPFFLNFGRMPRRMIWNDAGAEEYPSVREFATQKKLALLTAHDSILSARTKQTRDANRKRQAVPFKGGDLVYLSTKNITFPKGLARKLLPKFIGPYKIVKDFGNSSFQLELPSHLKRRGVHDVFHASLLRIHIRNDDRLFPGRMDTQVLSDAATAGDEWAVDRILSHHWQGTRTDAIFEILWKSGDTTWLPYYQITHLQALTDYFDLLGIAQISQLPRGVERPSTDDPQIVVGSLTFTAPVPNFCLTPFSLPMPRYISRTLSVIKAAATALFTRPFISPTVDLNIDITMPPGPRGVNHPRFTRRSITHYQVKDPYSEFLHTLHIGQIADFLDFDEQVRNRGGLRTLNMMPLGFVDFANLWNSGARDDDRRRFCEITFAEREQDDHHVEFPNNPVTLRDFFITADQLTIASDAKNELSVQHEIMQEFATMMMDQRRTQRKDVEQRKDNHTRSDRVRLYSDVTPGGR